MSRQQFIACVSYNELNIYVKPVSNPYGNQLYVFLFDLCIHFKGKV